MLDEKKMIDIESEALSLIKLEKASWEDGTAFITEKVAFNMRNLIRQLRKNYWGVFDEPTDVVSGRKKTWVPLTETMVESAVKNIDLDTKDINVRAKKPESYGFASLVRSFLKNKLDEIFFGEHLDEMERQLAIDGTAVWHTSSKYNPETKKWCLEIRNVDLLNFYIDPTARSIQETEAVIERIIVPISEFKKIAISDNWLNWKEVEGSDLVNRNDAEFNSGKNSQGETRLVEIFKRTGLMPKSFITGLEKDGKDLINGEIIATTSGSRWLLHNLKKINSDIKPYEEFWYTRVPGRWYGKGIAEKVAMLQSWLNTLVNIRINRAFVAQLGLFKIRRGSGITPQMLSRLASNGAILVKNMDDVEQFVMKEASQASYNDENIIWNWAERVTSAFEIITGASLPATTSATATAIQSRSAESQFVLIKEGIGMGLQRWLKRHALPLIVKYITRDEVIRVSGEVEELKDFDEKIANHLLYKKLKELSDAGKYFDPQQIEMERQRIISQLSKQGNDRYVKMLDDIDVSQYDVQVFITNEEVDKGVLLQNLVQMLQVIPNIPNLGIDPASIIKQVLDVMGLNSFQLRPSQRPMLPSGQPLVDQMGGQRTPQLAPTGKLQEVMTRGNVINQT